MVGDDEGGGASEKEEKEGEKDEFVRRRFPFPSHGDIITEKLGEAKRFGDFLHFRVGKVEKTANVPVRVEGHEVDVGVGDVGADDL